MGLNINGTRFLMYAKTQGVSFTKTATVGRQGLHLDASSLRKNLEEFGYPSERDEVKRLLTERNRYAEPFFEMLGSQELCSLDASAYEQATEIHDFNLPIA